MKRVGHAGCSNDKRNTQKIVVIKPRETSLFRLRRPRYVNNTECFFKTRPVTKIYTFKAACYVAILEVPYVIWELNKWEF